MHYSYSIEIILLTYVSPDLLGHHERDSYSQPCLRPDCRVPYGIYKAYMYKSYIKPIRNGNNFVNYICMKLYKCLPIKSDMWLICSYKTQYYVEIIYETIRLQIKLRRCYCQSSNCYTCHSNVCSYLWTSTNGIISWLVTKWLFNPFTSAVYVNGFILSM